MEPEAIRMYQFEPVWQVRTVEPVNVAYDLELYEACNYHDGADDLEWDVEMQPIMGPDAWAEPFIWHCPECGLYIKEAIHPGEDDIVKCPDCKRVSYVYELAEIELADQRDDEPEMNEDDSPGDSLPLHIYEVGTMSSVALVEAPSAEAAALFYGANGSSVIGGAFMAAVYKVDGREYQGDRMPWLEFAIRKATPELEAELERRLSTVRDDMKRCRFVATTTEEE